MTTLAPLTLEDQERLHNLLGSYPFQTYEYSFLSLYLWKEYARVRIGVLDDALIIRKTEDHKGTYFMQPIGYTAQNLPGIIDTLLELRQGDADFRYLFRDIEEPFLRELQASYGPRVSAEEDVKFFDYIYETEKLIHLVGDKLGKRKNQVHQFIRDYDYEVKDIHTPEVKEDCLRFSQEWLASQKNPGRELICEAAGIRDVFARIEALHVVGMAVYVRDQIAGFTFGEKINRQMAIIHVEKGDTAYRGIYAFLNKTFAERYLYDVPWVNREEDLGVARLRKAKQAYEPLRLEKKYRVNIR
ncbi:MAG: phosphatidylglycerol lysyltransferase domain-containing protein [Peptococcaceae bacterium]|jgi:hypothetical protein|nr:phosphatidylglycerol lysyltransferase domain-containing protein [Peptococcaceae bacterium]